MEGTVPNIATLCVDCGFQFGHSSSCRQALRFVPTTMTPAPFRVEPPLPQPVFTLRVVWECIRCHRVYAPHVDSCACAPRTGC